MNKFFIPLFVFIFVLSGCSPFGGDKDTRILVANGLSSKALYELAEEKINSGSIGQGIKQFKTILESYPGSKYAIQARLDIAYNLYKQKKYNLSILELNQFIKKYPNILLTPYAYYLKGVVAEAKSSSILDNIITDSAQRDVDSIRDAYSYYMDLINTFPNSKYSEDASKKLSSLMNTLARHELYVAIYYTEVGSHIAAINRSKFIIQNFPNSSSIPDSLHLMAHNYEEIGAIKLAADARQILTSSYPSYSPSYSIK